MDLWWVFDLILIIIVVLYVYLNAKKGFAEIIIRVVGYIVSIAAAAALSMSLAADIYKDYAQQKFVKQLEEIVEKNSISNVIGDVISGVIVGDKNVITNTEIKNIIDSSSGSDLDDKLFKAIKSKHVLQINTVEEFAEKIVSEFNEKYLSKFSDKAPEYVLSKLNKESESDESGLFKLIKVLNGDSADAANYIEENYLRGTAVKIIRTLLFAVLAFLFMMLVQLIDKLTADRINIPILGTADSVLGGVFGFIKAAVVVLLITGAVYVAIALGASETGFFSEETINKTLLFKWPYKVITLITN